MQINWKEGDTAELEWWRRDRALHRVRQEYFFLAV